MALSELSQMLDFDKLVPKSVTLNDLERRNGHYLPYYAEFGIAFVANYVKVID